MSGQGASEKDIQHHYDVGEEFYRIWLDKELVYTSALYEEGDSLERAQQRKLDYHLSEARAKGAAKLLDVGCGFGACMRLAIDHFGVEQAVGLTLSSDQADYIRRAEDSRISVQQSPWQEFQGDSFDSMVAIGVLEHVADTKSSDTEKVELYRNFFSFCNRVLKPGAHMSLQTIAYGPNMPGGKIDPFIAEVIFPGSDLPRLAQIAEAADGLMHLRRMRNDPKHYAQTCSTWADTIEKHRKEAVAASSENTVKDYIRYLRMSSTGFRNGALYLFRMTFQKQ